MIYRKPILFFHIPKTAGSSIQSLLAQYYAPKDIAEAGSLTTLLGLDRKMLSRKKLFQGHFYGPLEQIVGQNCFSFTILRDPIDRALSHYGHVLTHKIHYLHQRAIELGSFDAYLEDPLAQMTVSNFQARMLSLDCDIEGLYKGLTDKARANWELEKYIETTDFGLNGQALLYAAQAKLDKFGLVGITERFDETLALLMYKLGWPYPAEIHDQNVNPLRIRRSELSPRTLQRLSNLNEIDNVLYLVASKAFDKNFNQFLMELVTRYSKKSILQRLMAWKNG
jgi:hypothetical protein